MNAIADGVISIDESEKILGNTAQFDKSGWRENLGPQKGTFSQEYLMYFKKKQRICGPNFSPATVGDIVRYCPYFPQRW